MQVSPEVRFALLMLCACTPSSESARTAEDLSHYGFDWQQLENFAIHHGIEPLLHHNLKSLAHLKLLDDVDVRNFVGKLELRARARAIRNSYLAGETARVLSLFAAHKIIALPFKGATLAADAYRNIALRRFGDVDLIVASESLAAASLLLAADGYTPSVAITADSLARLTLHEYNLAFKRESDDVTIELHWRIAPHYLALDIPFHDLQNRSRITSFLNRPTRVLSDEDNLLALCLHGGKHGWSQLMWICDVAQLLHHKSQEINWNALLEVAHTAHADGFLRIGLALARNLFAASLPPLIETNIARDSSLINLIAAVRRRVLSFDELRDFSYSELFRFHLDLHSGLIDKAAYIHRLATIPSIADIKENGDSHPLYSSLTRPLRLAKAYFTSRN